MEIHSGCKLWSKGHSRYDFHEPPTNLDAVPEVKGSVWGRTWASCGPRFSLARSATQTFAGLGKGRLLTAAVSRIEMGLGIPKRLEHRLLRLSVPTDGLGIHA